MNDNSEKYNLEELIKKLERLKQLQKEAIRKDRERMALYTDHNNPAVAKLKNAIEDRRKDLHVIEKQIESEKIKVNEGDQRII